LNPGLRFESQDTRPDLAAPLIAMDAAIHGAQTTISRRVIKDFDRATSRNFSQDAGSKSEI